MDKFSTNQLESYAEDFYGFSSFSKIASVIELTHNKWAVVSADGEFKINCFNKTAATKLLRKIEFLNYKKEASKNPKLTYSAIVRFIYKEYDESTVREFQKLFKENFDKLYLEGNPEPENDALEAAILGMNSFHKNANAIEMGDPSFAGKRLSDLVRFLLRRIPNEKRMKAIESVKKKIYMINEYQLASKKTPPYASLAHALTTIKTMLLEHNPEYIRNVLNAIVRNL